MEDSEDHLEDEEADEEPDEPGDIDTAVPVATPAAEGDDVESIEDLLVKKEAREEEEDEESVLSLTREERLEPLAVKVVPPQPTEFICKKCYLVKHRSQLKDKTRMLCRDCA
jgi:hypothetical protein